jgi:hypothetical protein
MHTEHVASLSDPAGPPFPIAAAPRLTARPNAVESGAVRACAPADEFRRVRAAGKKTPRPMRDAGRHEDKPSVWYAARLTSVKLARRRI